VSLALRGALHLVEWPTRSKEWLVLLNVSGHIFSLCCWLLSYISLLTLRKRRVSTLDIRSAPAKKQLLVECKGVNT